MNIKGIDKAEILKALYNASKPVGLGKLHYDKKDMTHDEAVSLLKMTFKFDYLKGRVMKIDLTNDELETYLYNRDNGWNRAEEIIKCLK